MITPSLSNTPWQVMTVKGPVSHDQLGITDAHNHVWIESVPNVSGGSLVLNQYELILQELKEYRQSGGMSILDCQPGGCGRNGNRLLELSRASGVNLIACTGFHRKKYYPPDYWLWNADPLKISEIFRNELEHGLAEAVDTPHPVRAGFIKIALEATWNESPNAALEGSALTAIVTKTLLEIHTEKGALAEKACIYFTDLGVSPHQLMLCHMDKKPDISLHKALAEFGVLLEYDTFYRPQYDPKFNLWPLIEQMVNAGLAKYVALATDMADASLYRSIGKGPGLSSLPGEIQQELGKRGYSETIREQMLGGNISRRLAGIN
jgi:predicted metal-dependent phosphotriesterase family hydrolase